MPSKAAWPRTVQRALCNARRAAMVALLAFNLHASSQAQVAAAAPQAGAPSSAAPGTQYKDALRLTAAWLEAQARFERVPALSAGVVVGQNLVWQQAWGMADHAGRLPAGPDTLYGICSISKLFTAVAVMMLWEEGKVQLDDDVSRWLPNMAVKRTDPDSGPITLRSLLTHSSGLPREGAFPYWQGPDYPFPGREALIQGLGSQSTVMRAAERYQYSNLGMALLGEVVTAASGMPYEQFVHSRILAPLQMTDTRTSLPAEQWGQRLAQGFGAQLRDGGRQPQPLYDARGLVAAAGFSSNVPDLARFAAWQFRLRKQGGSELLRVATLREMQRVQWTDADGKNTLGLGFFVGRDGNQTVAGHTGVCPGYLGALALALNDEVATIALANANDNRSLSRYSTPMRRLMLKGLKLPVAAAGGPPLEDYAGRYSGQPYASEDLVLPWGKDLVVLTLPSTDPAGDMAVLRHAAGDTFRLVREDGSLGTEFSFVRNAGGRVSGLAVWQLVAARIGNAPPRP